MRPSRVVQLDPCESLSSFSQEVKLWTCPSGGSSGQNQSKSTLAEAVKRGGGARPISIDQHATEPRYFQDRLSDALSPDLLFDRRWAEALRDTTLEGLRKKYAVGGKNSLFEALAGSLNGADREGSYSEISERLAMTEAAVKMAAVRLRKRYGELLRSWSFLEALDAHTPGRCLPVWRRMDRRLENA
jgi:hypothetical protein